MKIGIDARGMTSVGAGRGRYSRSLILALSQCDRRNQYFLYLDGEYTMDSFPINFQPRVIRAPGLLWHILVAYSSKFVDKVDVYLALISPIVPALGLVRCAVVVHDLVSFLSIARLPPKSWVVEHLALRVALRKAKGIITVSESTREDVVRFFGSFGEKMRTIPEAPGGRFRPIDRTLSVETLKQYGVFARFILFVGTLEPRKNVVRLIEAYSLLGEDLQRDYELVIAGVKGWYYDDIFKAVQNLNLEDKVIFTGYVDEEHLPYLYSAADVFVYPSLYEGFGLPPLEAMACGTPVIVSSTSSLPEVIGNAGILVDPMNVNELAQSMMNLLTHESARRSMATRGLKRASCFSWARTAQEVLDVLRSVHKC